MISVAEASERILAEMPRGGAEEVPIAEAEGRVLRLGVHAERPFPPHDRVMMDGIGVSGAAWESGRRSFRLAGTAHAGDPRMRLPDADAALEVMTGAICPIGVEVIVPVEQLERQGETVHVSPDFAIARGVFIHREGSDAAAGAELLSPGTRLGPRELAVAISCGAISVPVSRRPRIAVVSTGDELVDIGAPIEAHQVRRSNVYALQAALTANGFPGARLYHFPDNREHLAEGLANVLAENDCVILSGGVSAGRRDHVADVLQVLGARTFFHRVAQRPGKPMLFGIRDRTAIFGLPGNPVSTVVGCYRHVLPALRLWSGETPPAARIVVLGSEIPFDPPLTLFLPVALTAVGQAMPRPVANSGDFVSLLGSDGFIELPADRERFEEGYTARFFPW